MCQKKLAFQTMRGREERVQSSLRFPSFLPFQLLGYILRLLTLQHGERLCNTLYSGSSLRPSALSMLRLSKSQHWISRLTERRTPPANAWALRSAISLRCSSKSSDKFNNHCLTLKYELDSVSRRSIKYSNIEIDSD